MSESLSLKFEQTRASITYRDRARAPAPTAAPAPPPPLPPAMKKKVDERVRTLIENGVKSRTRSLFVLVGDRGKDQVANLHYILSKSQVKARPTVLWCYNKELGFSTCVARAGSCCARARARR